MQDKNALTKALALAGTLLACFPILAMLLTSAAGSLRSGQFRCDYLMPAELFPSALLGGAMLAWAAQRARRRRGLIWGGLGAALALLLATMALAAATGLASGAAEPTGWRWALVTAALAGYTLALLAVDAGGVLLLRDLFGRAGAEG